MSKNSWLTRASYLIQLADHLAIHKPEQTVLSRSYIKRARQLIRCSTPLATQHTSVRRSICRRCSSYIGAGGGATVRLRSRRQKHLVVTCKHCKALRRYNVDDPTYSLREFKAMSYSLLLKTEGVSGKSAANVFMNKGVHIRHLNAIQLEATNGEELKMCLRDLSQFSGLIVTSMNALKQLLDIIKEEHIEIPRGMQGFCCGGKSATGLRELGFEVTVATNVHELCQFFETLKVCFDKSLLYVQSEISSSLTAETLMRLHIPVKCLIVYTNTPRVNFPIELKEVIERDGPPSSIVFFSGSQFQASIDHIKAACGSLECIKIISWGESCTTVITEAGYNPYGTIEQQNLEYLSNYIGNLPS